MPDLIPSEATTAGAIRQSSEGGDRCPECGAPPEGRNPFLPSYGRYECGSYERDDTATIECYRRQLAQAQAEVERLRRELDGVVDIAAAALDHVRKRYNGDSDSFGDIEEALLDAGFTMDDLDASPGLGQAREDALDLLAGEKDGDRCE